MSAGDDRTRAKIVSALLAAALQLPLVDRLVAGLKRFVATAGAGTEQQTDRGGFLSYHAETHAVGAGVGLGLLIAASGRVRYAGLLLEVVLAGNRGGSVLEPKLLNDVRQERHYFLGGLAVGVVLGLLVRVVNGAGLPTVSLQ